MKTYDEYFIRRVLDRAVMDIDHPEWIRKISGIPVAIDIELTRSMAKNPKLLWRYCFVVREHGFWNEVNKRLPKSVARPWHTYGRILTEALDEIDLDAAHFIAHNAEKIFDLDALDLIPDKNLTAISILHRAFCWAEHTRVANWCELQYALKRKTESKVLPPPTYSQVYEHSNAEMIARDFVQPATPTKPGRDQCPRTPEHWTTRLAPMDAKLSPVRR